MASRARVKVEADANEVRIVVDDDGPGIPAPDLERVFEPFVRLEGSRSRETGGAGLGLAIARSIFRAHGGDVTLREPAGGRIAGGRQPAGLSLLSAQGGTVGSSVSAGMFHSRCKLVGHRNCERPLAAHDF